MFKSFNTQAGLLAGMAWLVAGIPLSAFAATTNFFGPIVPQDGIYACATSAADWGGILYVIQRVINLTVSLGVMLMVVMIAYTGAMFVLNANNPAGRKAARQRLINVVIGLVIVLGAWLLVDFVMKVLYDPTGSSFGPWNSILAGGAPCILPTTPEGLLSGITANPGTTSSVNTSSPSNRSIAVGTNKCSPSAISSAASEGGYQLTDPQAKTLSCIAKFESSCGNNTTGATTPAGKPTSAAGMFQIILGTKPPDTCHSLNLPVCTAAAQKAGFSVSGNLNCSTAFSGGRVKAGMENLARACQAAASSLSCNASAAACLNKAAGNHFAPWTSDARSSGQQACINTFAGG
jgi:hypothetical protein